MPQNTTQAWQEKLGAALLQDPKKTGVLGFLVLILVVFVGRLLIGTGRPAPAAGAVVAPLVQVSPVVAPAPIAKPGSTAASLRKWLSTPIPKISRNDFLLKSEYPPRDNTKTTAAPQISGFWSALAKSLSVQADQKEKRDAALAKLKTQAAALRPTSIVMGPSPRAMVNGTLVAEGDTAANFRVLKIEARGIIVERDGVRLAIPMN